MAALFEPRLAAARSHRAPKENAAYSRRFPSFKRRPVQCAPLWNSCRGPKAFAPLASDSAAPCRLRWPAGQTSGTEATEKLFLPRPALHPAAMWL